MTRLFHLGRQRRESTRYLSNPGQGWYRVYTYDAGVPFDQTNSPVVQGENLALARVSLERYREVPLPEECLGNIRAILGDFHRRGVDLILRVAYDFEGRGLEKEPELMSLVECHLRQLAPVIREFEDRILVFQGLLIGSWGEMHQSKFLSIPRIQALEKAFRSGGNGKVWLAVRRPSFLRALSGGGVQPGRLTLFDDAVGGSDTDLGTFGWKRREDALWTEPWAREDELAFIDALCTTAPFGGEAVLPDKGDGPPPAALLRALGRMHLSYLNCQHDPRQLALWRSQRLRRADIWNGASLYDYIGAHMGYRFCLRRAAVKEERGRRTLWVEVENTGFGGLLQEAEARLACVDSGGARHSQPLDWNPCGWRSGSRTVCWARLELPPGKLYLELRRKWDGRPIRFANDAAGPSAGEEVCDGYLPLC